MKKIINKSILGILAASILMTSCSDRIMSEIDTNPNSPTSVTVRLLLPSTIMSVVYGVAGNFTVRQMSFIVEQTADVSVNNVFDPYFVNESLWQNGYHALNDTKILIDAAERNNLRFFRSIGQILHVYTLSILTDVYGDIPYSEALQGNNIRTPKFDSQESIYNAMFRMLDTAIASLSAPTVDNPGNTDLIFSGNRTMWLKTAYAFRARLNNRLSKINPAASATAALADINNSFANHTEGFAFRGYLTGIAHDNPWNGFQKSQRIFAVAQPMINTMAAIAGNINNDPRADRWFTRISGQFVGAPVDGAPADPNFVRFSTLTANMLSDVSPQPMIMYDELMFIKAEAHLRLNQTTDARNAFREGVRANMRMNGIAESSITAYIDILDNQPFNLQAIMRQKYISYFMFNPVEAFNDMRRTGTPAPTSIRRNVLRLPYPNTEANRNPNTPKNINEATIYTTPVWWAR
jgi:hypothetical protein